MRITIFGATGLLGKALIREWKEDDVTGFGSADGDIRDEKQVLSLVQRTRPDWIVLAAAYTDVDGCETNRDLAFEVNCKRSGQRCACGQAASVPACFSSAPTTSSTEPRRLLTLRTTRAHHAAFTASRKAEAEIQLGEILPDCCIVRTSWLFGAGGKVLP